MRSNVGPLRGADGNGSLLEAVGLAIHSRIGGDQRTIVRSLDLSLDEAETVGIVGESGSGKR